MVTVVTIFAKKQLGVRLVGSAVFSPTNRAQEKGRLRLQLEPLESRLTLNAVINVNAAADVHAISPDIYGAAFATTAQIADLNLTINRNGGPAAETYNWVADANNRASDWYYESIASGSGNGQSIDAFVNQSNAGGAQADLTVPILPYVASLGPDGSDLGSYPVSVYGPQQSTDPNNPSFGNGVTPGGQNITDTNPRYNYVANSPAFEQTWIQHLLNTFGTPGQGGVQYFTLGNEPGLWNSAHMDTHPSGETNTELLNDIISYGSMIKSIDPSAQILGPEEWGWTNYFVDGANAASGNYSATYDGLNVQQWLLQQLDEYQVQHGTRLLDYFTLHYYPQESAPGDDNGGVNSDNVDQATELLRNQATRSLWDPNYVDPSWIGGTGINGGKVDLIPMMQSWVNAYYPGTKTGISEYNFGAEGDMNGATAQADVYGIFGQQGLDLATRWTTPAAGTPTYLAMKLWRNYDGHDSGFGDASVSASVANPDQTDAFAALRSSDGALTVAVINKNLYDPSNPSAATPVTVNLSGFASNGVAQEWQLAAINPSDQTNAAITHLADVSFSGNSFMVNVLMESVTMFVIEPAPAPTVASFTPTSGPAGTQVVINGTNFVNLSSVTFNGTAASGFVVNSSTQITAAVPNGATTGNITVSTLSGTVSSSTVFTVRAQLFPSTLLLVSDHSSDAVYGQAVTFTATISASGAIQTPTGLVQFQIDGSNFGNSVALAGGSASTNFAGLAAGTHTVSAVYTGDSAFAGTTGTLNGGQLVAPAPLTITADSKSTVYGGTLPALTVSYAGFVNGDTLASLTTAPTLSTVAPTSPVGSYSIMASDAVNPDYAISYVQGTLTITAARLKITANNLSIISGGSPPELTVSYAGLVNGDTPATFGTSPNVAPTVATVPATSPPGTYPITVSGAVNPNYAITYLSGTLTITATPAQTAGIIVTGADAGGGPNVTVFDAATHAQLLNFNAFDPNFTLGVRVAVGDVTGDGIPDIIVGAGPGGGSDIKIFDQAGNLIREFAPFNPLFTGSQYIAVADLNNQGYDDIIVGADYGGGPNVIVFDGKSGAVLYNFFAYNPAFIGGVRVAAGDVLGNGQMDIICGAGPGGGPNVTVFQPNADGSVTPISSFFAYNPAFTLGIFVAGGAVADNVRDQVITGAGAGGGPNVSVFDGRDGALLSSFFAYNTGFVGGVRVATTQLSDGSVAVVTAPGPGGGPQVNQFNGLTGTLVDSFFAYNPLFSAGVWVAGA